MNPTEARLVTLRAMADYYNPKTNVGSDDVRRVILAEIAAIEAEARGGATSTVGAAQMERIDASASIGTKFGGPGVSVVAEPAPPPARPKRVKVTVAESIYFKAGKFYDVIRWVGWNGEYPFVICEDGTYCVIGPSKWVPADEPEGEDARERNELLTALELILPLAKGYACANNVGSNQAYVSIAEATLARARVKS